jgi:uncharacterized protein (DUF58 family)
MATSPPVPRFAWLQRLPFTREGLFWLLISLAMLITGLLRGINLINLLACWIITLILWNWWMARRQLRRLGARRAVPEFVFAQTPFRWSVEVVNAAARQAQSITVVDEAPHAPHAWFVGCVPAGQAVVLEAETSLPRRGVYAWQRLRLACGYPVGLANVVKRLELPQELLVLPRLGILQRGVLRHWLSQHSPTQGAIRAAARRQPTAQLEFHGLRTFRPGDSPRHIHWRTTARRGELMVREFEDLPNDNLILLVDPWTQVPAGPGDNAHLERLLSLAATICWEWSRQKGDHFVLGVAAESPALIQGVTGRPLALQMLSELARTKGTPAASWPGLRQRLDETDLPVAAALVLSLRPEAPIHEIAESLRRPVASVQLALDEERTFFTE